MPARAFTQQTCSCGKSVWMKNTSRYGLLPYEADSFGGKSMRQHICASRGNYASSIPDDHQGLLAACPWFRKEGE